MKPRRRGGVQGIVSIDSEELVAFVQGEFRRLADPAKAGPMAAYMKTAMPFYGIQKNDRVPVYREIKKRFAPSNRSGYERGILALWSLPHREEKYAAIEYAMMWPRLIGSKSLRVYERMIREGAWWDLVDGIAAHLVGGALQQERDIVRPLMDKWIEDTNLWIRRSAILSHLRHKRDTDWDQLSRHCLQCAGESEFFMRKAIGWALREYSKSNPEAVETFLKDHKNRLSGLSIREGSKHLPPRNRRG